MRLFVPNEEIFDLVCTSFGVRRKEMLSDRRLSLPTRARQVAMYLIRKEVKMGVCDIGRIFHRDHTTVLHACKTVEEDAEFDPGFARLVAYLGERIRAKVQEIEKCRPRSHFAFGFFDVKFTFGEGA